MSPPSITPGRSPRGMLLGRVSSGGRLRMSPSPTKRLTVYLPARAADAATGPGRATATPTAVRARAVGVEARRGTWLLPNVSRGAAPDGGALSVAVTGSGRTAASLEAVPTLGPQRVQPSATTGVAVCDALPRA